MSKFFVSALLIATAVSTGSRAAASFKGHAVHFTSPEGQVESCIALDPVPGAMYTNKDGEKEKALCAINFYDQKTAVCAKTWSTSPATMIYATGELSQGEYEAAKCTGKAGHVKIAKMKTSMNAETTSSTYANSSLLYYHFARYFKTAVDTPVSVYRSMDKQQHLSRVSAGAGGIGAMNRAAWEIMRAAEADPNSYRPTEDLFTADRGQIYGALLKESGTPYGFEINGSEEDKWGDGWNLHFQETPPFLALIEDSALADSIRDGLASGLRNPILAKAYGSEPVSALQMQYWMQELSEITLLDFIFNQQDRVGNIDFNWTWVYVDGGKVKDVKEVARKDLPRARMRAITPPKEIAKFHPLLLQRSAINDNDAGAKHGYTNFTRRAGMLQKVRHLNAETYRRLLALDHDTRTQGPLLVALRDNFSLPAKDLAAIVKNIADATAIFKQTCASGHLRFDLAPKAALAAQLGVAEAAPPAAVDCEKTISADRAMTSEMPLVSCVLPVYNAAATLNAALASLCNQSHLDWEAWVVDDGSRDATAEIARSFSARDPRIQLIRRPHEGLVAALNAGLRAARGRFIARQDADDRSLQERFARQLALLTARPELGLASCLVAHESAAGWQEPARETRGYAHYCEWLNSVREPRDIRLGSFIESPLAHPTVFFRRELIAMCGDYRDGDFPEDYDLWLRFLDHGVQMAKVPEELYVWSDSPSRLSRTDHRYDASAFHALKAASIARWLRINNAQFPRVSVWGAGSTSRERSNHLEREGCEITSFIDVDERRRGQILSGRPVWMLDQLPKDFIVSYVGARGARDQIRAHLVGLGRKEGEDFLICS